MEQNGDDGPSLGRRGTARILAIVLSPVWFAALAVMRIAEGAFGRADALPTGLPVRGETDGDVRDALARFRARN